MTEFDPIWVSETRFKVGIHGCFTSLTSEFPPSTNGEEVLQTFWQVEVRLEVEEPHMLLTRDNPKACLAESGTLEKRQRQTITTSHLPPLTSTTTDFASPIDVSLAFYTYSPHLWTPSSGNPNSTPPVWINIELHDTNNPNSRSFILTR